MNQQEFQGRLEQARGKVKEWTGVATGNEQRELAGKLEAEAGRSTALNQAASGVPDAQMQAVLDQLVKLGAKPVETLSVAAARANPTPADAVVALLQARGQDASPQPVAKIENRTIDGATGPLQARIYWPQNAAASALLPLIVYFHGGGWVIADLDVYDASPRALANGAQAIVISVHYRQAPEHRFPAAHDDAYAAWQWALHNAATLNGDPARIAIAGESAGGNLAASVAIRARDNNLQVPLHQLLIYPWPITPSTRRRSKRTKAPSRSIPRCCRGFTTNIWRGRKTAAARYSRFCAPPICAVCRQPQLSPPRSIRCARMAKRMLNA